MQFRHFFIPILVSSLVCSCGKEEDSAVPVVEGKQSAAAETKDVEEKPIGKAPVQQPKFWSEVMLHDAIRGANDGYTGNGQFQIDEAGQVQAIALDNCGVADLAPLAGLPLQALYLQGCPVPDVEALKGMPLVELYLENSAIKDLAPLKGMGTLRKLYLSGTMVDDLKPLKGLPIVEMNLVNTKVKDLSGLEGMPLQMLWLTDTPVADISGLSGTSLVSLTLHRTAVKDLSPLANTTLQRLHIGETPVTDLTPLKGLPLTRLVFDQAQIQKGLDVIKAMPTLRELGSKFEDGNQNLQPPAVYWQGGTSE